MLSPSLTTQTLESFVPDILAVSMSAQNLFGLPWFTNSTLVALVVLVLVLTAFRKATKNMQLVPSGFQNLFEALIELLYDNVEQIVGPKVAKQCFHLILTIFVYVLVANWFGLLPGVGTIGFPLGSTGFYRVTPGEKRLGRIAFGHRDRVKQCAFLNRNRLEANRRRRGNSLGLAAATATRNNLFSLRALPRETARAPVDAGCFDLAAAR